MKAKRLAWALEHRDVDFKNVIFSDESSVVLSHRRGSYKIWRKATERVIKSCIRPRWKGYSEFMFWGCFSYDQKGPCHIWQPETKAEKAAATAEINSLNAELEPKCREEWELYNGVRRCKLSTRSRGRKPTWRWSQKTGMLARRNGNGIDWWRYRQKILLEKLLPFAKRCQLSRPGIIVQEDGAPCHRHWFQEETYKLWDVAKMLWPGNSPDLNAIEPCWFWIKKQTTRKGAPATKAAAQKAWEKAWRDLPQEQIRAWIERIPYHIEQIIKLEGGNEYDEGRRIRPEVGTSTWGGRRVKGLTRQVTLPRWAQVLPDLVGLLSHRQRS